MSHIQAECEQNATDDVNIKHEPSDLLDDSENWLGANDNSTKLENVPTTFHNEPNPSCTLDAEIIKFQFDPSTNYEDYNAVESITLRAATKFDEFQVEEKWEDCKNAQPSLPEFGSLEKPSGETANTYSVVDSKAQGVWNPEFPFDLKQEPKKTVKNTEYKTPPTIFQTPVFVRPPHQGRGRPRIHNYQRGPRQPGTPFPRVVSVRNYTNSTPIKKWTVSAKHKSSNFNVKESIKSANSSSSSNSSSDNYMTSTPSPYSSSTSVTSCSSTSDNFSSSAGFSADSSFDGSMNMSGSPDVVSSNLQVDPYDDEAGLVNYFLPMMTERENHNIKERNRRSRVSAACSVMRRLTPGLNDKTDKATVFEQAAKFVAFLKSKVGKTLDQAYLQRVIEHENAASRR